MAIAIMGAVFGAVCGVVGTAMYYEAKLVATKRRMAQLQKRVTNLADLTF